MKLFLKVVLGVLAITGVSIYIYYVAFNHYFSEEIEANKEKSEKIKIINTAIYTMNLGRFEFTDNKGIKKKFSIGFKYKILTFDEKLNINSTNIKLQNIVRKELNNQSQSNEEEVNKNSIIKIITKIIEGDNMEFKELIVKE